MFEQENQEKSLYDEKIAELDQKARQDQIKQEERSEELRKKNHDFVQFTRKGLYKLSQIKNGLAVNLFLFLAKEMDKEAKIVVSQETLAEIFECSRMSISTAVKELVKNECIDIYKVGNTNVYCLNAFIVWNQARTNLEVAKFKAQVIISKKEQVKIKASRTKMIEIVKPEED